MGTYVASACVWSARGGGGFGGRLYLWFRRTQGKAIEGKHDGPSFKMKRSPAPHPCVIFRVQNKRQSVRGSCVSNAKLKNWNEHRSGHLNYTAPLTRQSQEYNNSMKMENQKNGDSRNYGTA